MNLTKMKKKKGFTLIELMAVIAIIAILAAVLVPTVSGYIERSKKTAIITQVRNVVSAVETHNATESEADNLLVVDKINSKNPTLSDIKNAVGNDLLSPDATNKLDDTITLDVLEDINKDTNSIKNIQINQEGKITYYTNGAAEDPITWSE
ncbi:prepilin-type N-terminal cleavage/methylation domain-containing protein [Clostridium saudiense]|uniref:prepilin-type N-terminal cleavage/methylation domain-containing protein n=1 Tax=Clostridium saudiense TaxID=1414720 RepID=UPI00243499C3|nr:prepilin-type N-terminal cleavage/methylation domain-containing protein [Clostridium saudiense]